MALDLADLAVGIGTLLVIIASALLGGFLANMFYGFYGYSDLRNRILSLENTIRGNKGVAVKAGKEERLNMAIAEAGKMLQEGAQPMDIAKALAPRYPDVAMELVKKGMKGEIPGLGDFLGEEE